jgi:hypothetical protein
VIVLKVNSKKETPIIIEMQVIKGSEEDADQLIYALQMVYRRITINFSSASTYLLNVPQQRLLPLPDWTDEELNTSSFKNKKFFFFVFKI